MTSIATTASAHDRTDVSAVTKMPYRRKITSKRRQQNRESQKKYREKVKKRLAVLEEQVINHHAALTTPHQDSSVPIRSSQSHDQNQSPVIEPASPTCEGEAPQACPEKACTINIDLHEAFTAVGDLPIPTAANVGPYSIEVSVRPQTMRDSKGSRPGSSPQGLAFGGIFAPGVTTGAALLSPHSLMPAPDPSSPNLRAFWQCSPAAQIVNYQAPPLSQLSSLSYRSRQWAWPDDSMSPLFSSVSSLKSKPPDPYLNRLRVPGEMCLYACFDIAAVLGISMGAYVNDHPSFFYHSTQPDFQHLPRTLRPTPHQLMIPHPVYLDCIIWPTFRSRAIALSAKGELDHHALFIDLYREGLVCRGSAMATHQYGRDMRDGVAWSTKSWEARPWFLKRWAFLVGSEIHNCDPSVLRDEDGIWEQSRWWWSMRGDDE